MVFALTGRVHAQGVTEVSLRPAATVARGAAVRLGDVAKISGPEAERLGAVVVVPAPAKPERESAGGAGVGSAQRSISLEDVRRAVERAGINVSRVTFSGSTCATRERTVGAESQGPSSGALGSDAASPATGKVESAKPDGKREFASVSLDGPPTVRTLIARRLGALYAVEPEGLRLRISESRPAEAALLAERVDDGRRYEVTPGGSSLSGRLSVRVDVYEGDRLAESASISVEALVARAVCIVSTGVSRGDVVTEADVTIETRWLSPAADTPPHPSVVIGQSARRRLEPGRVVTDDDVRAAVMVERGEEVSVHTLSGSVVLKSKARAMAQGRQGDAIEVRREGAARSFTARVSERGVVVVALDAADPDAAAFHNDPKGEGGSARKTGTPRPRGETPARVPPPAVPKPRTRATR